MNRIPLKIWNRIDMLQAPIAAEVPASAPGRRRWVDIHYDLTRKHLTCPPHRYCIIDREFDAALLAAYAPDGDEDLAMLSIKQYYVADAPQLYAVLAELGAAPGLFEAPWNVGHPLL
ncbi:hypothetical protein [Hymenobacter metallicola]|uniref:Uncharacterized protein n=1 Tax=Hymenobacter metallicola TaxID=2563114 RepID=A0A4Z0PV04_9BACT|nr:hypothetical protein [Hymenobacter metallicola]TGE21094.1 hypothetical protein E5K02_24080 [Hymenobacter metallicola]